MYNLGDSTWKHQPPKMSFETFQTACGRIFEHCHNNNRKEVSLVMHGGEPMLVGLDTIKNYRSIVDEELTSKGIKADFGMQTNGTIFSIEIADFFLKSNTSLGVSLDGPPDVNNLHRVDHKGKGSSERIEKNLSLLLTDKYRHLFKGFLAVINVNADPVKVLEYLFSFNPPMVDLLFPDDNYDRRPKGKEEFIDSTLLGDWIIAAFDYWYHSNTSVRVRYFENIIKLILGGDSDIETIGTSPADFIIVETNGDIELLDSLKGSFEGATKIGKNIFNDSFDDVANFYDVRSRQIGIEALCDECKKCEIVNICGGGYLPHRFSLQNNYNNPSVYCSDLKKIISHVYNTISKELVV